uniref:Uncharacterized protein n=1 Tax=Meleagris gallopavo TaxID=9103 RepID=A0A803Y8E0_MELGA
MQDVFGMQELLEPRAGVHRISPPPSSFQLTCRRFTKQWRSWEPPSW